MSVAARVLVILILLCFPLGAQPRMILIIRHAEKPASVDPNLTPKGYQRAAALVSFFSTSFEPADYLFASKLSKRSNRCVETLTPLASAMHMRLNSNIPDEGYAYLAHDVLTNRQYTGKMLIICWHHGKIPALAKALGVSDPPKWPDSVFDRVWRIRYSASGLAFDNLPQHLLPGDSDN